MEKTIEIPEGYEARIEGNKVILEPKESEDERIRKEMLNSLKETEDCIVLTPFKKKSWIAYLERQKEQKPVQDEEEREYVRTLKSLVADFVRNSDGILDLIYYQQIYDWLDGRHIEQQPAEWKLLWKPLEESMEALLLAIEGKWDAIKPTGYMSRRLEDLYDGLVNTFNIDEKYLNKLSETEYTEKDKDAIEPTPKQDYSGLTDFERAIHRGFLCAGVENVPVGIIKDTAQDCLAHIKPAEWSEEDKRKINRIYEILGHAADDKGFLTSKRIIGDKEAIELQDFLKSLRLCGIEKEIEL